MSTVTVEYELLGWSRPEARVFRDVGKARVFVRDIERDGGYARTIRKQG